MEGYPIQPGSFAPRSGNRRFIDMFLADINRMDSKDAILV